MQQAGTIDHTLEEATDLTTIRGLVHLIMARRLVAGGVALACVVVALVLALVLPSRYAAEAVVLLDTRHMQVVNADQVLSGLAPDGAVVRSEIDVMKSSRLVGRIVDSLGLAQQSTWNPRLRGWLTPWQDSGLTEEERALRGRTATIEELKKHLDIQNDGRSYAIRLVVDAATPTEAEKIANALADAYLTDQLEVKYEATERANAWLSDRLAKLKEQVEKAESAVATFRREKNLTQVSGSTISDQQLGEINGQLVAARAERSQAEARLKSAQAMARGGGVEASSDVLSSSLIQSLREQESQVRRETAELSDRYGDRHPRILSKRAELRDIQAKIGEEVQKIVRSLASDLDVARAKENSLQTELNRLQGRVNDDSQEIVTLHQLEREAQAVRAVYESFLNRFKQTSEQSDLVQADARIIARAVPPLKSFFPNIILFLASGCLLGLVGGVGTAWLVESMDRGFRRTTQVERATGIPAIGIIPTLTEAGTHPSLYAVRNPTSGFGEALRSLRTAIHFSNLDSPPRVVMLTSAVPGEGKTTLSVSMARLVATSGMKVLLIEADLRRPTMHTIFGFLDTLPGLAECLAGDVAVDKAVFEDAESGLHVLHARAGTRNPQDLLGSKHMRQLLADLAPRYDLVVIDTPPIMAVSDAAVLAPLVDATVMVARWAHTPRDVVLRAMRQLQYYNVRIAGVALTQVQLDQYAQHSYGSYSYTAASYYHQDADSSADSLKSGSLKSVA